MNTLDTLKEDLKNILQSTEINRSCACDTCLENREEILEYIEKVSKATRERDIEVVENKFKGHGKEFKTERAINYEHAGKSIAQALRNL